jgi:hypothetical protein
MQAVRQQPKLDSELSILYARHERVVSLIRFMEHYQLCIVPSKAKMLARDADLRLRCHLAK